MPATAIKINRLTGTTVDKVPMRQLNAKKQIQMKGKVICDTGATVLYYKLKIYTINQKDFRLIGVPLY